VRFHDGEPLTSDDVKFSFDGIIAQVGQAAPTLEGIREITCPDDTTVVFKLEAPNAGFLGILAYNGVYILPRHIYEGKDWIDADSMMDPVGSGPFKWEKWEKGVSISLVRNGDYYLGPEYPYLDRIICSYITDPNTAVQSFYNGELDILGIIAPSGELEKMMDDDAYTLDYVIYPSRFYIGFNFDDEVMADHNFRMAVAHALDADDMVSKAMKTTGLKSEYWISPVFEWAMNTDESAKLPAFDLEKAKEYMEATGLEPDANGVYLTVELDTYNYEPFPDAAVVLKDHLSKIGIDVTINMLEYAAWEEKIAAENFIMVLSGGYQGPDVSGVGMRLISDGVLNYYGYSNPDLDAKLAEAAQQPSQELQAPLYREAQQIMNDDMPQVLISEWLGYIPYYSYVKGHPASAEAVDKTAFGEFTYMWLDK
jgi:peptide/nickel transport system substrate-binding protein